jgi:hypothetical protein
MFIFPDDSTIIISMIHCSEIKTKTHKLMMVKSTGGITMTTTIMPLRCIQLLLLLLAVIFAFTADGADAAALGAAAVVATTTGTAAFLGLPQQQQNRNIGSTNRSRRLRALGVGAGSSSSNRNWPQFQITVDLPPRDSGYTANLAVNSVLSDVPTELVVVRYRLPFGLSVEPSSGLAVVTQAGPNGERVGDVLRYCSQWTPPPPPLPAA